MGFLSKLHRLFQTPPEMFRNVSRGIDARLSGSTPGPAVVNAGMGNYFEALRQSKENKKRAVSRLTLLAAMGARAPPVELKK